MSAPRLPGEADLAMKTDPFSRPATITTSEINAAIAKWNAVRGARPVFVVTAPINAPGRFVEPLRHVGPVKSGSLREVKPS